MRQGRKNRAENLREVVAAKLAVELDGAADGEDSDQRCSAVSVEGGGVESSTPR